MGLGGSTTHFFAGVFFAAALLDTLVGLCERRKEDKGGG